MDLSRRVAALEAASSETVANDLRVILSQIEKIEAMYANDPRLAAPDRPIRT